MIPYAYAVKIIHIEFLLHGLEMHFSCGIAYFFITLENRKQLSIIIILVNLIQGSLGLVVWMHVDSIVRAPL